MSDLDTKLRRYMQEAVQAVEPVTADEIVSEATSRRPRRRWASSGLAAAAVVVAALLVVGVAVLMNRPDDIVVTTPDHEEGWVTYRSDEHRFEIRYPAEWNRAGESLTPNLVDPNERLTLTTGPALVGGDRCRNVPERAMNALERDGILITLQVRGGGSSAEFPPKPDRLGVDDAVRVVTEECAPEGFWHKRFDFSQGGRAWYAYVTVGPEGDRGLALRVLDTFTVLTVGEAEQVVVPDVEGRPLAEAVEILEAVGLDGGPVSGPGWSDPAAPVAIVVSQKPHAGAEVPSGVFIGFRTAVINGPLCEVFADVPDRGGDANDLARSEGYWEMLHRAQPHAEAPLHGYIERLLEHRNAGGDLEDAPPRTLDSVTVHHRACSGFSR